MDAQTLKPAKEIARANNAQFPNESADYRRARNDLLVEEIELRRHMERVAEMRRALPKGGEAKTYKFTSKQGAASLGDLFGDHETLAIYSYMFGPQREKPCPMCTSFMDSWDFKIPAIEDRIALVFTARSPIERQLAWKTERGWKNLKLIADTDADFTRDYISKTDDDMAGFTVFTRRDGTIRHFFSGEIGMGTEDPGQDPRGSPEMDPLWALLDATPEGRGKWYPKLNY